MAFSFRISWFCTLLWGCLCFPPQKGYNTAHGFYLHESPQTSGQFHSGQSLNTNNEDENQAMGQQTFVSRQQDSYPYDERQYATPEMKPSQLDSALANQLYGASSTPPVQRNEQSGYQHPFNLLVRGHTQQPMKGVSFPTMNHLKWFIENMKNSFLVPGRGLSRHFETAQEKMKNLGKSMDYRSSSNKEGTAYVDSSIEQGANDQMPDDRLSFPDSADSSASLISSSVYDNQKFSPGTTVYPHNRLAATELVSRNLAQGFPQSNGDIFVSAPKRERVQSERYKQPEQTQFPSSSYFGKASSYSGHVTATAVNIPKDPSQDFNYYSSKTSSLTPYKQNLLNPVYEPHSKDSLMGYQRPSSDSELGKDFHGVTQTDVLSQQKPPSVYSHDKEGHRSVRYYWPKYNQKIAASVQANLPTEGKELKVIKSTPGIHQPFSRDSVSLRLYDLLPQWSRGRVGYQTSSKQDPQTPVINNNQMDRSHQMFTAKPSGFFDGSSRDNDYLGPQTVGVTPSILNAQAKDEKSDPYNQNLVSAFQKLNYNESRSRDSHQHGLTSYRTRSPLSSFYKPRRQTMRAGHFQPFIQSNMQMSQATVSRQPRNLAHWLSGGQPEPKGLTSKCVIKRNTKSLPPQEAHSASPSSVNTYVKSKNRFTRATAYLSKICYTPHKRQGKTAKNQWRLAMRQHK